MVTTDLLLCCSKALSQRVSVYSKKLVGEQDALAVEVRSACIFCMYLLNKWIQKKTAVDHHHPALLQIKSLQANLQRLRKAAAGVKAKNEQATINALLSETAALISGVGPGGDL